MGGRAVRLRPETGQDRAEPEAGIGAGPEIEPVRARGARRSRVRRTLLAALAALVAAAVALPVSAAARPHIPAPPPASLGTLSAAGLERAYEANRANATQAARMADTHGGHRRAATERAMARPARHFLLFDGRGQGRAAEVFGDLAHATRVAVLVPGSDTSLDTYARFRAGAAALQKRLGETSTTRTAVIAWLGYETPGTVSPAVLTATRADEAAPELKAFLGQLRTIVGPRAQLALLCHSYGSVVCARTAPALHTIDGPDVSDIALFGSPGTGTDSAAALHTTARVWAARGGDDWIANVPHTTADLFGTTIGFGTDPVSPSFGARLFSAGDAGHSGYFAPGSVSLANLARIVLGETPAVSHA